MFKFKIIIICHLIYVYENIQEINFLTNIRLYNCCYCWKMLRMEPCLSFTILGVIFVSLFVIKLLKNCGWKCII